MKSTPPRGNWTEKAYPNLIYYNRLPKGGHFVHHQGNEGILKNFAPRSSLRTTKRQSRTSAASLRRQFPSVSTQAGGGGASPSRLPDGGDLVLSAAARVSSRR